MPSGFAHVAIAAALLAAIGFRGHRLMLGSLWAFLPDLDVATAIPWLFAAPNAPLSADALIAGQYLFSHRGFSHTFTAALLVAGVVYLVKREKTPALVAGGVWASHVVLDGMSPWPVTPLWPISTTDLSFPIVTTLDPLLTIASLAACLALVAPWIADRWSRFPSTPEAWHGFREDWAPRLAAASFAVLIVNTAWLGLVAANDPEAGFAQTYSANLPRTVTVTEAESDGWTVTTRWAPFGDGDQRFVPRVDANGTPPGVVEDRIRTASCTLEGLGPYASVATPAWRFKPGNESLVLVATDVVRNATSGGGPSVSFAFEGDRLVDVGTGVEEEGFRLPIPGPVVEAARCR